MHLARLTTPRRSVKATCQQSLEFVPAIQLHSLFHIVDYFIQVWEDQNKIPFCSSLKDTYCAHHCITILRSLVAACYETRDLSCPAASTIEGWFQWSERVFTEVARVQSAITLYQKDPHSTQPRSFSTWNTMCSTDEHDDSTLLGVKETLFNDKTVVKIGSNARENWQLVDSDESYTWLHLNSYPSCHVVIESYQPTQSEIIFAAQLCKENTKYRNLRNLKICYTTCGNLRKGIDVGSVVYKSKRKVKYIVI